MAFTPISTRLNSLPYLIAGPILRSVSSSHVTIFIVTRVPVDTAESKFYYSNGNPVAADGSHLTASGSSKQVGDYLHLTYLQANISTQSDYLQTGQLYEYDLELTIIVDVNGVPTPVCFTLSDTAMTGPNGFSDYLYDGFTRPNFVFIPSVMEDFDILHGSCRKPNGGWTDTLVAADKIINSTKAVKENRPNLLIMSGDQIYADDVADQLLFLIKDAEKTMVNLNEKVDISDIYDELDEIKSNLKKSEVLDTSISNPFNTVYDGLGIEDHANKKLILDNLIPGIRGPYIHQSHLTVDPSFRKSEINKAKSHLMSLGEYMLMYVFVWSDVLWPASENDFPTFAQVYNSKVNDTVEDESSDFNEFLKKNYNTVKKKLSRMFPGLDGFELKSKYKERFEEDEASLKKFRDSLKKARRAMAHVPCLMMIDDHEVTDDLFLNRAWVAKTIAEDTDPNAPVDENGNKIKPTKLSKRIISNGLAAAALFQTNGNDSFKRNIVYDELGSKSLLEFFDDQIKNNKANFGYSSIESHILPKLVPSDGAESGRLVTSYDFSTAYQFSSGSLGISILDTRCNRGFPKKSDGTPDYLGAPALISEYAMFNALTRSGMVVCDLQIIVTPSPIFGHNVVETALESAITIAEQFGASFHEYLDGEAWSYNRHAKEKLIQHFTLHDQVVILSGDVHYAYSIEGKYWDENNPNTTYKFSFAQLTGSSLKNKDLKTVATQEVPILNMYHFNWKNKGKHVKNADIGTQISSWLTPNKQYIPDMTEMDVKYFDGIESDLVNYYNNFWGSLWDDIKSFDITDIDLFEKFEEFMDSIQRWATFIEWMLKNREEIANMLDDLKLFFDQLVIDYQFIKDNWPDLDYIGQQLTYWAGTQAKQFLYDKFVWLDDHWDDMVAYWDGINEFFASDTTVSFVFPFNIFYKVIDRPEIFYRVKSIKDERPGRKDPTQYNFWETWFDLDETYGPVGSEELKLQQVSISSTIKYGGFAGKEVVGTNNLSEISFVYDGGVTHVNHKLWSEFLSFSYDTDSGVFLKPMPKVSDPDYHLSMQPWTQHTVSIEPSTSDDIPLPIR